MEGWWRGAQWWKPQLRSLQRIRKVTDTASFPEDRRGIYEEPCRPDGTCDPGLSCVEEVCVAAAGTPAEGEGEGGGEGEGESGAEGEGEGEGGGEGEGESGGEGEGESEVCGRPLVEILQ